MLGNNETYVKIFSPKYTHTQRHTHFLNSKLLNPREYMLSLVLKVTSSPCLLISAPQEPPSPKTNGLPRLNFLNLNFQLPLLPYSLDPFKSKFKLLEFKISGVLE
jgi:hypothetical protein